MWQVRFSIEMRRARQPWRRHNKPKAPKSLCWQAFSNDENLTMSGDFPCAQLDGAIEHLLSRPGASMVSGRSKPASQTARQTASQPASSQPAGQSVSWLGFVLGHRQPFHPEQNRGSRYSKQSRAGMNNLNWGQSLCNDYLCFLCHCFMNTRPYIK